MKRLLIIPGLLAALCGFSSPSTNQLAQGEAKQLWEPTIRVQFLGMTNDAAGVKLARFELHNIGEQPWDVSLPGFIDLGIRSGGHFGSTNATLQSGASVETRIPVPTDRDRWRAEFLCKPPTEQAASSIYSEYLPPNLLAAADLTQTRLPPAIPLKDAVGIAEGYVAAKKIDASQHYLASVRIQSDTHGQLYWDAQWMDTNRIKGGWFIVRVQMDRSATLISGK